MTDGSAANRLSRRSVGFHEWTGDRDLPSIGTNKGAKEIPFQGWHRFKEAFTPELIARAIAETPGSVDHLVDPFGGSSTAALAAQFCGVRPTTIEVNPFLADLIEAKIASIRLDTANNALEEILESVASESEDEAIVFEGAPQSFIEPGVADRYIFPKLVAKRILEYRTAIEVVHDEACRRLFRVVLGSTAVASSNIVISGKGRRYRKNWRRRQNSPELVDELFRSGAIRALNDLHRYARRECLEYTILRGDARKKTACIDPVDVVVFSPPYPNSFDYTDVYNVELWVLGYLRSSKEVTRLRNATMRSHVQLIRDFSYDKSRIPTVLRTVRALRDVRSELWNRHIPEMIGAYAADLATVMQRLHQRLRSLGRVYIVVGNSLYAGVNVPVADFVKEIADQIGYELINEELSRSMRSSAQQGGQLALDETLLVLQKT